MYMMYELQFRSYTLHTEKDCNIVYDHNHLVKVALLPMKRVQLKGKPFQVFPAADDMDVEQTEARVTLIDPTISVGKYQQTHMNKARGFKDYIGKYKRSNIENTGIS